MGDGKKYDPMTDHGGYHENEIEELKDNLDREIKNAIDHEILKADMRELLYDLDDGFIAYDGDIELLQRVKDMKERLKEE